MYQSALSRTPFDRRTISEIHIWGYIGDGYSLLKISVPLDWGIWYLWWLTTQEFLAVFLCRTQVTRYVDRECPHQRRT